MISYRRIQPEDFEKVCNLELRDADKNEVVASTGLPPSEAFIHSLIVSRKTWVLEYKGNIEAVFGYGVPNYGLSKELRVAVPWALATNKFKHFAIYFTKLAKRLIEEEIAKHSKFLINLVDSRNKASIKWLQHIGFTVDMTQEYFLCDPDVPFYMFYKSL